MQSLIFVVVSATAIAVGVVAFVAASGGVVVAFAAAFAAAGKYS